MTSYPCGDLSWKSRLAGHIHIAQFVFRDACVAHDEAYDTGGTAADRLTADLAFYASMKEEIRRRPGRLNRAWLRWWAWVYYRAVRQAGDHFFRYGHA